MPRKKYEQVHESYKSPLERIEAWNKTALQHGALTAPYEAEAGCLKHMIEWGKERLANPHVQEIVMRGISIGSLRYAKAALLLAIRSREEEISQKKAGNWPDGVLDSVNNGVEPLKKLAQAIDYPPAEIYTELGLGLMGSSNEHTELEWGVFICHASEDKEEFIRPLAEAVQARGLKVWYDEFTLTVGDSLRRSIDWGLARSKYGIVVLSPSFFAKEWPQKELDGLVVREVDGRKVILPVWHNIDVTSIRSFSPILADRVATSSEVGLDRVVEKLLSGMGITISGQPNG